MKAYRVGVVFVKIVLTSVTRRKAGSYGSSGRYWEEVEEFCVAIGSGKSTAFISRASLEDS